MSPRPLVCRGWGGGGGGGQGDEDGEHEVYASGVAEWKF